MRVVILSSIKNEGFRGLLKNKFPAILRFRREMREKMRKHNIKNRSAKVVALERGKIEEIRGKELIRVAFVISFHSAWKLDSLYTLMLEDSRFSPFVVIAPIVGRDASWSRKEINTIFNYHDSRSREIYVGNMDDAYNRLLIDKANPDIVFATNPFPLVPKSLHAELLKKYLMCYVPYHMEVGRYGGDQGQYNSYFHNSVWKIFSPHSVSLQTFRDVQIRKGRNVIVTGYPGIEPLLASHRPQITSWKIGAEKKIIWAPHHTIDMPSLPYSNFLKYAELFMKLVDRYSGRVHWSFKPHPLLYPKLIEHPDWGKERTNAYYAFWKENKNSQFDDGGYTDLFIESDAMIHDSGSFLAEYLYVDKPVLYVWSSPSVSNYFNDFGLEALDACARADCEKDIVNFIEEVLEGRNTFSNSRRSFLDRWTPSSGSSPSARILSHLSQELIQ
jgi:hypothetical protein